MKKGPFTLPFEKAYEMVEKGEITHGASCVLLLKLKIFLANS